MATSFVPDETSPVVIEDDAAPPGMYKAGTLLYTKNQIVRLFLWLLGGDFVWQLRERAITPIVPALLRSLGANDTVAVTIKESLPNLMGIFLNPSVSFWSDRYRSPFGRRIPFLLIATVFAVAGMFGLAFCESISAAFKARLGTTSHHAVIYSIAVFTLFWVIFEIGALICLSLHGALINDVVPRPLMGRFFGLFRAVSCFAGVLLNLFLLAKIAQHTVTSFLALGSAYGIVFSLMCLKVKEGSYPAPPPLKTHRFGPVGNAIQTYFRDCFTKPYYLWFFLSFFLAWAGFTSINACTIYYKESVGMSWADYGKFSALQLLLSMLQAPIIGWLCDRFHPLRVTIGALFCYAATTLIAFFTVRGYWTFAAAHVICGTCSGMWLTATAPLSQVLMPRMKFASFASAQELFAQMGRLLAAPVVGFLMDWLNGNAAPDKRDYHHIFLWASCFVTLSMLVTLIVYRYFQAYGGTKHYIPPE